MVTNDIRYGKPKKWGKTSFRAKTSIGFRCSYPNCNVVDLRLARSYNKALYEALKALTEQGNLSDGIIQTHHASYLGEVPGEHLFPLCQTHHGRGAKGAHNFNNWYQGPKGLRDKGAHQKGHYHILLIQGYKDKKKEHERLMKELGYGS